MADDRRYSAADVPVTAEEVAHRGFATTFRGFDPNEVRHYLTRVAESLRAARAAMHRRTSSSVNPAGRPIAA